MTGCETFRERINERLDGELAEPQSRELDAHLAACDGCREIAEARSMVVTGLRHLPEHCFPEEALEKVFDRTLRSGNSSSQAGSLPVVPNASRRPRRHPALLRWTPLVAAAAMGIIIMLIVPRSTAPDRPTPAEMAKAQREVRVVLSLTAQALSRAQHAASDRVLADEVAPALRRVPIRWHALHPERKS